MTTIAICGSSGLLSFVKDHLSDTPSVTVVSIEPGRPGSVVQLASARPDITLVEDSGTEHSGLPTDQLVLALIYSCTNNPVIRIEPGGAVSVLNGHRVPVKRLADLVQWIASMNENVTPA